jgi:hypothetical protein
MRRLQVLLESKLDVCAYNLTTFLIKHVFEHKRPKFVFLHQDWLKADKNNANSILDIHLALMYRRKDDTSQLHFLVSYRSPPFSKDAPFSHELSSTDSKECFVVVLFYLFNNTLCLHVQWNIILSVAHFVPWCVQWHILLCISNLCKLQKNIIRQLLRSI